MQAIFPSVNANAVKRLINTVAYSIIIEDELHAKAKSIPEYRDLLNKKIDLIKNQMNKQEPQPQQENSQMPEKRNHHKPLNDSAVDDNSHDEPKGISNINLIVQSF